MNESWKGFLMGLIAMFFLSGYSVFGKILLENLTPETLSAVAQSLSAIAVLFFFGFFPELKKIHTLPKKDLFWLGVIGVFSAVLAPLFLLKGLENTSATNALLIGRLEPVFVGILSFLFLKEEITKYQVGGAILMFLGIAFIGTEGFTKGLSGGEGNLFILLSAFLWSIGTHLFKKYLDHIAPELVVLVRNSVGAVILFTIIPFVFPVQHNVENALHFQVLLPLVLFAVFTIVIAQILWYKTLEILPATKASALSLTSPFFGVLLAFFVLHEQIFPYHFLGGIFIFLGLLCTLLHHQQHPKHHLYEKIKHWFH